MTGRRSRNGQYTELARRSVRTELDAFDAESTRRYGAGVDRVVAHPLTEAFVQARGGWQAYTPSDHLLPVIFEVAVAVGLRSASSNVELIWAWDQFLDVFEHGLGWFALLADGLVLLPRPVFAMPRCRLHCIDGPAVKWPDGSGHYFLCGVKFDFDMHYRVANRCMTAAEALAIHDPDQEVLAIAAAPPDEVLALLNAVHLDTVSRALGFSG